MTLDEKMNFGNFRRLAKSGQLEILTQDYSPELSPGTLLDFRRGLNGKTVIPFPRMRGWEPLGGGIRMMEIETDFGPICRLEAAVVMAQE